MRSMAPLGLVAYPAGNGMFEMFTKPTAVLIIVCRLFIVEGAVTIVLAVVVLFCLPDCMLPICMWYINPNQI